MREKKREKNQQSLSFIERIRERIRDRIHGN